MRGATMGRRGALTLAGVGAVGLLGRGASAQEQVSDVQMRFANESLEIGRFLLETSQAAAEMVSDEDVAEFAQLEIAEQEAMREVVTSLGVEVPPLEPQHENGLAAIQQGGGEMSPDLLYVNAQILGHGSLLKTQQALPKDGMSTPVVVAMLAEPAVKTHLAMLSDMKIRLTG